MRLVYLIISFSASEKTKKQTVVLTRRGMRSSTNAYLTALAIADLVYLLCVFWLSLSHYPQVKGDVSLSNFYAYTWPYSVWLTDATSK